MQRQRRLFGVLHDQRIEAGSVGQRPPHHPGVGQRPLAVGERHSTSGLEQADLGQLLAVQPLVIARIGIDLAQLHLAGAAGDELDHGRLVDRRVGIGQDRHAGDAAGRRRGGAAVDALLVLGAGLAELDPHVDQAGRQAQTLASITSAPPGASAAVTAGPSSAIRAAHDQHPPRAIEAGRRVEQPGIDDAGPAGSAGVLAQVRVSASSTAMRTATPIST